MELHASSLTPPLSPRLRGHRWVGAIVLLLAFFAFAASLTISRQVFERVPHLEDEVAYLFQAKVFAHGAVVAPLEFPKSAFWQPFVIEDESGTRYSKYPPGWSILLAVGVLLGLPAVVNAALSALTVVVTFALGRDAFNTETGLIAAALTAFSPMALLLNATLMTHTLGLCCATLFMWAYVRMARASGRRAFAWAALSGLSLGLLIATRPLSAVAVALPFILWSGIVVLRVIIASRQPQAASDPDALHASPVPRASRLFGVLVPLLVLSAATLLVAALVPLYNAATAGSPTANLYTLYPGWEYDKVGFGPDVGRNGHSLTKGVQFARYDLTLTAADLFGWQASGWTDMLTRWVNGIAPQGMVADSYWPVLGLSWVLLPFGLIVGLRREWAVPWVIGGALWLSLAERFLFNGIELWALVGVVWLLLPLVLLLWSRVDVMLIPQPVRVQGSAAPDTRLPTWLLLGVLFALVAVHTAYWIGSQRYSTRYYAEGLTAAALLSALPLAWLARRGGAWRVIVAVGLIAALAWSYFGYSVPRISALRGYNRVTRQVIDGVMARREGDRPVLVLVTSRDARWRTRAALWTLGSPFLESDIEVALVDTALPNARESILARLPGRQVIDMGADVHDVWFMDTCDAQGCEIANPPVNPTLLTSSQAGAP